MFNLEDVLMRADLNYYEVYRETTRRSLHGGTLLEEDGLLLFAGSHPSPFLVNGAVRTENQLRPNQILARAREFFFSRQHDFSFVIPTHGNPDLERAAVDTGLLLTSDLPFMIRMRPFDATDAPDGARVREVTDAEAATDFLTVAVEAYAGGDLYQEDMVRSVLSLPKSLIAPNIAAFVAYIDAKPLSIAMVYVSHGVAAVAWVGTRPEARKAGLAGAVVRAATNAGFGLGARLASLSSLPAGESLYKRLGFAEITRHHVYEVKVPREIVPYR